jgi:hypothetical protein
LLCSVDHPDEPISAKPTAGAKTLVEERRNAGALDVIKAVLKCEKRKIPPTPHGR